MKRLCVCLALVAVMFAFGCKKAVRPDGTPAPEAAISKAVADTNQMLVLITVASGDFAPQADAWLYSDKLNLDLKTKAYDDGTHGDKVAGDKVYTVAMSPNDGSENNTPAGWTKWAEYRNVVMWDKYGQKAKAPGRPTLIK
jgi:hypothetical protein